MKTAQEIRDIQKLKSSKDIKKEVLLDVEDIIVKRINSLNDATSIYYPLFGICREEIISELTNNGYVVKTTDNPQWSRGIIISWEE